MLTSRLFRAALAATTGLLMVGQAQAAPTGSVSRTAPSTVAAPPQNSQPRPCNPGFYLVNANRCAQVGSGESCAPGWTRPVGAGVPVVDCRPQRPVATPGPPTGYPMTPPRPVDPVDPGRQFAPAPRFCGGDFYQVGPSRCAPPNSRVPCDAGWSRPSGSGDCSPIGRQPEVAPLPAPNAGPRPLPRPQPRPQSRTPFP